MGVFDFDENDNEDPLSFGRRRRLRQTPVYRQAATPEETQALSSQLLSAGGSGLNYLATSLDKPGRALRGLLGGKPRELAAAIPFSDTLGITDPKDEVTGADLNQKWMGLRNDNSWKSWGAGLLTEGIADPLNLASFGTTKALTTAGKQAAKEGVLSGLSRVQRIRGFDHSEAILKMTGHTPEEIAHLARQGKTIAPSGPAVSAGGLTSYPHAIPHGVPLSGIAKYAGVPLGTGRLGEMAARGLDAAGNRIGRIPVVAKAASLFDPNVKRAMTPELQAGFREAGTPYQEAAERLSRMNEGDINTQIHALVNDGAQNKLWTHEHVQDAVRMAAEGAVPSSALPVNQDLWRRLQPLGGQLKDIVDGVITEEERLGNPTRRLGEGYFMRSPSAIPGVGTSGTPRGSLTPTGHASQVKRKDSLRDIPGGTALLQKWSVDPDLAGRSRPGKFGQMYDKIKNDMIAQQAAQGVVWHPPMADALDRKARQVIRYLGMRPDEAVAAGIPLYTRDIVKNLVDRQARSTNATTGATTLYHTLGNIARPMAPGMVPVDHVLAKLKGGPRLVTQIDPGGNVVGMLPELHRALARQGLPMTEGVMAAHASPDDAVKALQGDVRGFGVTPQQAENIAADYGRYQLPREVAAPMRAVDSLTNAFRNLTYGVWPNSQVRNLTGGIAQAFSQTGTGPISYGRAGRLINGNTTAQEISKLHPGLPFGLSDEQARQWLWNQGYAEAKIGKPIGETYNLSTVPNAAAPGDLRPLPGMQAGGSIRDVGAAALASLRAIPGAMRHPLSQFSPGGALEMAGVGSGTRDFPWLAAVKQVGQNTEDTMRMSQWLGQLAKGVDPTQAGRDVLGTHFDYSNMTAFEKNVMRRVIPFYTYMRKNLPIQVRTAATNPRAIMPQLRLSSSREDGEFVPQHLKSGVAIPTGPEQDGNRQFISQVGLPTEEAFSRIKFDPSDPLGSLRDTALAYLGMANPLIKAPLEQLTDRQFYSGRKLSDLKPQGMVGSLAGLVDPEQQHSAPFQILSQALANSPASRFISTADKIADPRKPWWAKALNLGTGVRVTDVDMEKARAIESKQAIEEALRHYPQIGEHTNIYVKKDQAQTLTPEMIEKLRALVALKNQARQAAEQQRQPRP